MNGITYECELPNFHWNLLGLFHTFFLVADGKSLLSKCGVEKNMGLLQWIFLHTPFPWNSGWTCLYKISPFTWVCSTTISFTYIKNMQIYKDVQASFASPRSCLPNQTLFLPNKYTHACIYGVDSLLCLKQWTPLICWSPLNAANTSLRFKEVGIYTCSWPKGCQTYMDALYLTWMPKILHIAL